MSKEKRSFIFLIVYFIKELNFYDLPIIGAVAPFTYILHSIAASVKDALSMLCYLEFITAPRLEGD